MLTLNNKGKIARLYAWTYGKSTRTKEIARELGLL